MAHGTGLRLTPLTQTRWTTAPGSLLFEDAYAIYSYPTLDPVLTDTTGWSDVASAMTGFAVEKRAFDYLHESHLTDHPGAGSVSCRASGSRMAALPSLI